MGIRGIPDLINGVDRRIYCRVKTDGKICSRNIFINGARYSNTGDIKFVREISGLP